MSTCLTGCNLTSSLNIQPHHAITFNVDVDVTRSRTNKSESMYRKKDEVDKSRMSSLNLLTYLTNIILITICNIFSYII